MTKNCSLKQKIHLKDVQILLTTCCTATPICEQNCTESRSRLKRNRGKLTHEKVITRALFTILINNQEERGIKIS